LPDGGKRDGPHQEGTGEGRERNGGGVRGGGRKGGGGGAMGVKVGWWETEKSKGSRERGGRGGKWRGEGRVG